MKYTRGEKTLYLVLLLLSVCIGITYANYKVYTEGGTISYRSTLSRNRLDRVAVELSYRGLDKNIIPFKGYIDKDDYRNYMTSSDGNYILSLYKHRTDLDRCDVIVANSITDFKVNFKEEE